MHALTLLTLIFLLRISAMQCVFGCTLPGVGMHLPMSLRPFVQHRPVSALGQFTCHTCGAVQTILSTLIAHSVDIQSVK